jgi:esterase/lipase superfamily enzyme
MVLEDLRQRVFNASPAIRNVILAAPAADEPIRDSEVCALGAMTLTYTVWRDQ